MIKLIDNSSRDVFFAYANEIARVCDYIGLNANEIIGSGKLGYKRTDIAWSVLNFFSAPVWPAIIKSRILFIRGVKRYVFIKKLTAITIPATIPKENSASAKNKNIAVEIKKQKLNRRGNIILKNFLENSSSNALNTVGEVTTIKDVITPMRKAFSSSPMFAYIFEK